MTWNKRVIAGFLGAGILVAAGTGLFFWHGFARGYVPAHKVPTSPAVFTPASGPELITEDVPIQQGDTFAGLLDRAGMAEPGKAEVVAAVQASFDVRKFRAGSDLTLSRSTAGSIKLIEYIVDPDHKLQVVPSDDGVKASVVEIPGITRTVPVCGVLQSSLFESMEQIGERPDLALQVADIFAYDMDFYTDPQEGDEFCLLVEKREYANGQPPSYRRILAATYKNNGTVYDAFLFNDGDGKPRYFSRDGHSLQSPFLRSPLKFEARVSSHFSRSRFHPVLKIFRPHLGTDYAAPTGTPVQSVAAGRVVSTGYSGGGGNMVRISHSGGYETYYLHLSRILVRPGAKVDQGGRIGLVGATGLATGPHLDFRMRKNGNFVNFESLRLPRATVIAARQRAEFESVRDDYLVRLQSASPSQGAVVAKDSSAVSAPSAP